MTRSTVHVIVLTEKMYFLSNITLCRLYYAFYNVYLALCTMFILYNCLNTDLITMDSNLSNFRNHAITNIHLQVLQYINSKEYNVFQ